MTLFILLRRLPAWIVNGITVTLGLTLVQVSISLVAGTHAAQIAIAAAVCASLSDVVAARDRVARRVLAAGVASIASGTLFLAIRPHDQLLLPGMVLIVFFSMLLLAWGTKAGSVSFAAALSLVFSMSLPATETITWERFTWGIVGTAGYWLWAVVTAQLLEPTWRKFAIISTALGEASLLEAIAKHIRSPMTALEQSGILQEEATLADRLQNAGDLVFSSRSGPEARLEIAVLLHLMDLRDLAMASNLESSVFSPQTNTQRQAELKARIVEGMAACLRAIARHLQTSVAPVIDVQAEQMIGDALAELEPHGPGTQSPGLSDANSLLHSKLQLLRSLQRLFEPNADVLLPCQQSDLRRYITPDEWRLTSVISNLRPSTPVFRHALRTAITAGIAYGIARHSPLASRSQWIILTITAVMQGSLAQTLIRRNARVLGTLVGCFVVALLTIYPSPLFLSACFLVAAGVAHAFFGVRYFVTAGAAAVMAVLQSFLASPANGFSTIERFADTVAGALLGWAATYVLPVWERKALPSVLQRATEAMRAYAAEATALRTDATGSPRFARQQAYDAIRAVSAIRTRSLAEPASVRVPLSQLTAWLSAAYGVMSSLSNLRLTLTLYGRDEDKESLDAAMRAVTRRIDALLDHRPARVELPPVLEPTSELALAAVPHLAARVRLAFDNISRVSLRLTQMQAFFATGGNAGDLPV